MSAYKNPLIFIPMIAMFVIIFGIVSRSLREIDMFPAGSRLVVALCVTIMAMYGMDQTLIRAVVSQYTAMGVAMLFGPAGLLLSPRVGLTAHTRNLLRRPRQDDVKLQ